MSLNVEIYDKFERYTFAECKCTLCRHYKGRYRGCSFSSLECCCAREKIEALMRERGLNQSVAECFVAENRGVPNDVLSAALLRIT